MKLSLQQRDVPQWSRDKIKILWYITTVPLSGIIGAPMFAAPSGPKAGPGPIAGPGNVPLLFIFIPIIGGGGGGPWFPAGAGLKASMQNSLHLELS